MKIGLREPGAHDGIGACTEVLQKKTAIEVSSTSRSCGNGRWW
jgi:hypothetical protein